MKTWERKELARKLRRQGLSYREIAKKLCISKSSISFWCKDIELTHKQIARLAANSKYGSYIGQLRGAKANQIKRSRETDKIKTLSGAEISSLSNYEFKIAGLMLYWAEGHKSRKVGVSNSDPELIRFMMRWFREVCSVPEHKFKIYMQLHSGQDEIERKRFWSEVTGLPFSNFGKTYIKEEGSGHRKNILYNGTLLINICNSNLLYRILGWIEGVIGGAASSTR